MSLSLKELIRDRLVDDSTLQTLLGVTTTGSAPVAPVFMEQTGRYPQIIYSITDGPTDPGMDSQNGSVAMNIMVQSTGGLHPHITFGNIQDRISGLFDDQSVSGAAFAGTGVVSLLFLKEGGTEVTYNDQRKAYSKIILYSYKSFGG